MSLVFNMLSRFVIAFLPRSKCLFILWLQSPSAVILKPKKRKSVIVSIVSPSICHEVRRLDAMILVFWMLGFKPAFSLSSFTFIKNSYWHRINTQSMIAFVMYLVLMGTNFNFLCSDVLDSLVNFEDIKNGCVLITM